MQYRALASDLLDVEDLTPRRSASDHPNAQGKSDTHPTQSQQPITESGRADNSDQETTDVMEPTSSQRAAEPVDAAPDPSTRAVVRRVTANSLRATSPTTRWSPCGGTDLVEG